MSLDMVDHGCCAGTAKPGALDAQGMTLEVLQP
jgi:hypothetical protein